ncbi:MAG TPA: choice-of-anchor tandem repeat GloVer-containing protein [Rhizomicrobium sp.]|nr:choice-of-anchor tandem repeat GloVer-containing protein [Rhizomicrobium sp.]
MIVIRAFLIFWVLFVLPAAAWAGTYTTLHAFSGLDGQQPRAGLIADSTGNLFGATAKGGAKKKGVLFRLAPDGTGTVLHTFTGKPDGAAPLGTLVRDATGNLYGTASLGGANNSGTIFKLAPNGVFTVLYSFPALAGSPQGGLVLDPSGNLYGTTKKGGASGYGILFRLAPDGSFTVLHSFTGLIKGGPDGAYPQAALVRDSAGNLYGTTFSGGAAGFGVIFKLAANGAYTVLHSMSRGDGIRPLAPLILDNGGNLYGTASAGGGRGFGTVFRLAPNGTLTVLYNFQGRINFDGSSPRAGLVLDKTGNLYGTTLNGGAGSTLEIDLGIVFKLAPDGTYTVLHSFVANTADGTHPYGELLMDASGNLYGTASAGAATGFGTVFKMGP